MRVYPPQLLRKMRGFSLIELLIVMVIISILSGMGIYSTIKYNKSRLVEATAQDFANTLGVAKSRAFTQVKPSTNCSGTLVDWRVSTGNSTEYSLDFKCSGSDVARSSSVGAAKKLPTGVTYNAPIGAVNGVGGIDGVIFKVLTREIVLGQSNPVGPANYIFTDTDNEFSKTVSVYKDGRIVVQ